ncbi:WW domain binding protein 11-domain-containing protein, partial [Neohortaea acidophila]
MPKEKSVNPAAAQRKADKQKEIAKSKKQQQAQRNEKLARRNPERLQRQVDELKELEARGTPLRPKDQETLKQLERDLKGVRRAREALGEAAPKFRERRDDAPGGRGGDARTEQMQRRQGHQQQHLGKRRRDADDAESNSEASDAEVRDIPMPKDTPPPIPHTARRGASRRGVQDGRREPHALPAKPVLPPAQTVYSSAPQIKDLKKEAARFVPAAVAAQKRRMKGEGRLLEPEEADRLEQAGYVA